MYLYTYKYYVHSTWHMYEYDFILGWLVWSLQPLRVPRDDQPVCCRMLWPSWRRSFVERQRCGPMVANRLRWLNHVELLRSAAYVYIYTISIPIYMYLSIPIYITYLFIHAYIYIYIYIHIYMNNMISSLQCKETRPGKISPLSINRQESIGPVRRVDWDQSLVELTHTTRQGCRKTQLGLTGFVQKNNTHHRYTVCIVMYIDTCTSTLYSQESTFNDLEHIYI